MERVGGWTLERQKVCDSSNSELLRRAATLADRHALVVDNQLRGRGRQGRRWLASGSHLCLSLFRRLPLAPGRLGGLSLAVGIGVARTLHRLGAAEVGLKWPNDLLARGAKLGGILIEFARAETSCSEVVIGIGLNLRLPAGFDPGQPAIDLDRLGLGIEREALLSALLPELDEVLERFCAEGFAPFLPEWERLDLLRGKEVELAGAPGRRGTVLGVAEDGSLRLADAAGVFTVSAGEPVLRPACSR